ncbi:STAS domain-containing protein [Streptomyces sp. 351MFTsu5.1]|uniref:STAS domain-containing protein n=1 Tax=Streptomyces sp. 351MFTsu5.1 TaxID=1172180 RepID=UPI00038282E7|nr:STAS domain-containing protein [Streptomyces sp. 351MFTsu5.1]
MTESTLTVDQQIHEAGPILLKVTGELDHHTAPWLTEALDDVPLAPGAALVVDFSDLTYCDSTGITVLVTAYHRAEAAGSAFSLAGLGRDLTRMFQTVGLDQVFALHPTADAAVAALRH